mmetsp:Transcript_31454/g.35673  ORF Transcript_31454/g.35673 Transcript_31454/m.35673 type:complete len:115 (-) Transcript_31454:171-515(-)
MVVVYKNSIPLFQKNTDISYSYYGSMGDTFQILVKTGLTTKYFLSCLVSLTFIAANIVGSQLVVKLGMKYHTAIATLLYLVAPISALLFSFCGLLIGSILGFLGSSQMTVAKVI